LLAAGASVIAVVAVRQSGIMVPLANLGVGERLALSAYGLSFYLWKMVAPFHLIPLYPLRLPVDVWETAFVLSYGVGLGITAAALALRRRVPGLGAVWAAYVVILLPILGLVHNGPQIAADRYTYLASLGWALLAGAGALYWWARLALPLTGLAVCVLVGLGVLTWGQTRVWRDSETLWTYTLSVDRTSHIPHNNLGIALARQGKVAEATEHIREALRVNPDVGYLDNNWVWVLARQGKLAEAIAHYRETVQQEPDSPGAHFNLGVVLARQGELAEATEHYREALRLRPDSAEARNNWGNALLRQGKLAEAIEHYREALRLRPGFAEAHNNWGLALARQGNLAEAIEHYQRAVTLRPSFSDAYSNLLRALAWQEGQEDRNISWTR
jgi:tetratricopeptide (TPR) repeat protein